MYTTYVGSFPLDLSRRNLELILNDVIGIPIDYPCYPQLMNFVEQFLIPLMKAGIIEKKDNVYILVSELTTRVNIKEAIKQAVWTIEFLKRNSELRKRIKGLKACITGPYTLASQVYPEGKSIVLKNALIANHDYVKTMADYLKPIIMTLAEIGYNMINIDDPFLGLMVGRRRLLFDYELDDILDVLDSLAKTIPSLSGIHVCGRISPQLAELLSQSEFKVLDHEFADTPENLTSYTKKLLEDYDKQLAAGVISSKKPKVESLRIIIRNIEAIINRYGIERLIFIKPDCGFRGLKGTCTSATQAYDIALRKLNNLKKAKDVIITKYRGEIEK